MRLNISVDIPEGMMSYDQELYREELMKKLKTFRDKLESVGDVNDRGNVISSESMGILYERDTLSHDIYVTKPIGGLIDETFQKMLLGDVTTLVGYAIAANCGEPLAAFPNIPITPLFGEMFVDPDSEDKTPQSSYYIAQGINPFEHSMEDVPGDQQHIVLDFIVPKMDETISTILPTVFDKNPRLTETDTTDVYLTEEWFSGEPKLVCSFNLYADSSEDAIEHSVKMGQAFIEELRDKLIEKNESEGLT